MDAPAGTLDAAQLHDEHEALLQFLYLAPIGLVQTDAAGEVAMLNPIAAQLLMPLSRDGGLDNLFGALEGVAPELRHLCAGHTAPSGKICDGHLLHLNAGSPDQRVPQVLSLTLLRLDAGRLMAVLSDVTEQLRRERQLRQSDAWLNAILTGIADYALVGLDADGRIHDWNPSVRRVTGHGDEVIGQPYSVFYPPDAITREHLDDRLREADADGWILDEGRRLRADGSSFWGSAMIAPLPERGELPHMAQDAGAEGAAYCLILRDISDKRDAAESRRRAHFADYLTGLANRRAFFEAAGHELERSRAAPRTTALVLIDADHFKAINDGHGHPGGDAVLQHLAARLLQVFREVDVVARIGGEEFAVLLPSTGLDAAIEAAERLRAAIALEPARYDGAAIDYTVSAGVAVAHDGEAGIDLLLRQADRALYAAKRAGRNRVERWRPALDAAVLAGEGSAHAR